MGQGLDGTEGFYISSCNDRKKSFYPRIIKCVMHMLTNFFLFPTINSMGNGQNVFFRFGLAFAFLFNVKKVFKYTASFNCNYTILKEISSSFILVFAKCMLVPSFVRI
jgi:hypothetical protein